MFNNFDLTNEEILKIMFDYDPLILSKSSVDGVFDEDLYQEIKIEIYMELSKNRKK